MRCLARHFPLIVMIGMCSGANAQQVDLVSLFRTWNNIDLPDSARLNALHEICTKGFFPNQLDSSFHYSQVELDYATAAGNLKYQAAALNTQGTIFRLRAETQRATECYSRSLSIREAIGDKKSIAASLNNLGAVLEGSDRMRAIELYERSLGISEAISDKQGVAISLNRLGSAYNGSDPEKAMILYQRSLEVAQEVGDSRTALNCLNKIGALYSGRSEYPKAIEFISRSLAMTEAAGDQQGTAYALNNLAMCYQKQGDHARAIETYLRGLAVAEAMGDERSSAVILGNIGVLHKAQGDFAMAMDYYSRSIKVKERIGDLQDVAVSLVNLGELHLPSNPPLALEYFLRSLRIREDLGDIRGASVVENNIGEAFRLKGHGDQALMHYRRALNGFETVGDKEGLAIVLSNIGLLHGESGNLSEALSAGGTALDHARASGSIGATVEAAKSLFETQKTAGRYRRAYEVFLQYISARDSMNSALNQRAVTKQMLAYELHQEAIADSLAHMLEANRIEEQKQHAQIEASNRRGVSRAVGGVGALLLLATGIILVMDLKRRSTAMERRAAHLRNQVFRAQVNPHFIHTALKNINDYVQANERDLASSFLTRFARLMRAVLENARKDEVSLASDLAVMRDYLELEKVRMKDGFQYTIEVDPAIDTEEVMVPPMLLQPFAEEAIWKRLASKNGVGHVVVSVRQQGTALVLSLEDDAVMTSVTPHAGASDEHDRTTLTRSRLELLAKQEGRPASVQVVPLAKGQRVELTLPLQNAA